MGEDYTNLAVLAMLPLMDKRRASGCLHPEDIQVTPNTISLYRGNCKLAIDPEGKKAVYTTRIYADMIEKARAAKNTLSSDPSRLKVKDRTAGTESVLELEFDLTSDPLMAFIGFTIENLENFLTSR